MEESNNECKIADAANTYNWALTIVKSKGYKIFLYPDKCEDFYGKFYAINQRRTFVASDPLRLLGIVALWETLGDDWQNPKKMPCENLYDQIATVAFPESSIAFEKFPEDEFQELVSDYNVFFDRLGLKNTLSKKATRQEFYNVVTEFYNSEDQ